MPAIFAVVLGIVIFGRLFKALWEATPFLLIGISYWAAVGFTYSRARNSTPEQRRINAMKARGDGEHARLDETMSRRADKAYQDYLDGKNDGGFPALNYFNHNTGEEK